MVYTILPDFADKVILYFSNLGVEVNLDLQDILENFNSTSEKGTFEHSHTGWAEGIIISRGFFGLAYSRQDYLELLTSVIRLSKNMVLTDMVFDSGVMLFEFYYSISPESMLL